MKFYHKKEELTGFYGSTFFKDNYDIKSDFMVIYGLNDTTEERLKSWKNQGYSVHLMVGISWGDYSDYLNGKFDNIKHWDSSQTDRDGKMILHSPDVPYIVPTMSFTQYLTQKLYKIIDLGVSSIFFEEPEFWASSGYSPAFKQEWEIFYHESWQPPHLNVNTQYKASKLKAFLFKRCLDFICSSLKSYAKSIYNIDLKCYIATHSLLNYSHWGIISPISMFMDVGSIDGFVARIWSGTARTPNIFKGIRKERTFLTAMLEYGIMQELTAKSTREMWFMHDPVEDNPSLDWSDYSENYLQTVTASLFHPDVYKYIICPLPERIFEGKYPLKTNKPAMPIPAVYKSTLLSVFNQLRDMKQTNCEWEGNPVIGVFMSDSAMFQRNYPDCEYYRMAYGDMIDSFSYFYGLCMPFLQAGIPCRPLQLENVSRFGEYLNNYKIVILSYEFLKPYKMEIHYALLDYVLKGGIIVYVGDDSDPFKDVDEWWNSGSVKYSSPADHLFDVFKLSKRIKSFKEKIAKYSNRLNRPFSEGIFSVGKGFCAVFPENPSLCAYEETFGDFLKKLVYIAADRKDIVFRENKAFIFNRGPYKIISVPNESADAETLRLSGRYINLFDIKYEVEKIVLIDPGQNALLYDLSKKTDIKFEIIATCARVDEIKAVENGVEFFAKAPADVCCSLCAFVIFDADVVINGENVPVIRNESENIIVFSFDGCPSGTHIEILKKTKKK